jgi:hypothetical protein
MSNRQATFSLLRPDILRAIIQTKDERSEMQKKNVRIAVSATLVAVAAFGVSPVFAGDLNNALGGAVGGAAGAALGGAVGGSTGSVIGGAVGGGAGGAITSNRRERTGAIVGGALGGGVGAAAGNAMGGPAGGIIGAAAGGGGGAALGGHISRANSYADDYRGHPGPRHRRRHHHD